MAGTLFGLPLSQQVDANGDPLAGGLLYIYEANSTTPATVYEDFALTSGLERTFPMELDSAGRVPAFWLADGSYRARLTTSGGTEIFDIQSVTAIGASSGASAGSGSGVSATAIFQTGDTVWTMKGGTRSGWVRMNGRTIGGSASGATERANADTQSLYEYLWNNFADSIAPVTGGRGASATADFNASKPIVVPSMQGRLAIGVDDMGTTAAGVLTGETTAGDSGGSETATLTDSGQLPSHLHAAGTLELNNDSVTGEGNFLKSVTLTKGNVSAGTGTVNALRSNQTSLTTVAGDGSELTVTSKAITNSTAATGNSDPFNVMNPYRLGTWYIKL